MERIICPSYRIEARDGLVSVECPLGIRKASIPVPTDETGFPITLEGSEANKYLARHLGFLGEYYNDRTINYHGGKEIVAAVARFFDISTRDERQRKRAA
jgi:hypothetical protein